VFVWLFLDKKGDRISRYHMPHDQYFHVCVYTWIHVCAYVCMCAHLHTRMYVDVHIHIHKSIAKIPNSEFRHPTYIPALSHSISPEVSSRQPANVGHDAYVRTYVRTYTALNVSTHICTPALLP